MKKIIDGKEVEELQIDKLVVNNKEIDGLVILPEHTNGNTSIHVSIHTKNPQSNQDNSSSQSTNN